MAKSETEPAADLPGTGPLTALPEDLPGREALIAAGIEHVEAIAGAGDLTKIKGIGKATAKAIAAHLHWPDDTDDTAGPTLTPVPEDFPRRDVLLAAGLESIEAVAAIEVLTDIEGIDEAAAKAIEERFDLILLEAEEADKAKSDDEANQKPPAAAEADLRPHGIEAVLNELPEDFPFREQLAAAGFNTEAKVRKCGDLTAAPPQGAGVPNWAVTRIRKAAGWK